VGVAYRTVTIPSEPGAKLFTQIDDTFARLFAILEPEWEHHFTFRDENTGLPLGHEAFIHVLEIGKFARGPEALTQPLERWMYFLKHGQDLDPNKLPPELDLPIFHEAMEVLMRISESEKARAEYLSREAALMDKATYAMPLEDARRFGRNEGREEGKLIAGIEAAEQSLGLPLTPESELDALPAEELRQRLATLAEQLRSRPQ
jgi:hypothetical protein